MCAYEIYSQVQSDIHTHTIRRKDEIVLEAATHRH